MTEATKILVIDDSTTIRRLVDSYLSPEGYHVVLAPNAEDGLQFALELLPDMILLDHQLPGTTGYDVCCQLRDEPKLRDIPVVISSTLRKKAYVEYADLPNVVDMLPKPYTSELLTTTVRNALDTGAMVVASQSDGSAVPEVIDEVAESDLTGAFTVFTLRETLDFLTNTAKQGVLEVEGRSARMCFYLSDGRIQGATAFGLQADELEESLPADLAPLAPVLRMTLAGSAGNQLQGLVELLDKNVVDGQLLKRMLRHQASQLLMRSFKTDSLVRFQFQVGREFPAIVTKLPLEVSTLALLVDGALAMPSEALPRWSESRTFTRRMSRSHSLDRSGMATKHVKLASLTSQPQSMLCLAEKNDLSVDEAHRVLFGLSLGELVEVQAGEDGLHVAAVGFAQEAWPALRVAMEEAAVQSGCDDWSLHELRDSVALKMLLRRSKPDVLLINTQDASAVRSIAVTLRKQDSPLAGCAVIAVGPPAASLPSATTAALPETTEKWGELAQRCWRGQDVAKMDGNSLESCPVDPTDGHSKMEDDLSEATGLESVALMAKLSSGSDQVQ